MNIEIDLENIFLQQAALEKLVRRAKEALRVTIADLDEFNEGKKKELLKALSEYKQTTGNALTDEIIVLFGLDKSAIKETQTFNKSLMGGKEILIVVPRLECTKHVLIPTPGCENEYAQLTGYIYGIPSGKSLVIRKNDKKNPTNIEIILPLKRYIKWDFEHGNTDTPVDGPLIVNGGVFNDLDVSKLLAAITMIGKVTPLEAISFRKIHYRPGIEIIIRNKISKARHPSDDGEILVALKHGRSAIKLATPSEKLAGAEI